MGTNPHRPADLVAARPRRHLALAVLAAVLFGTTLGLFDALINAFGSEFGALRVPAEDRLPVLELLDTVFVSGLSLLLVALVVGWFASTKARAAGLAIVTLEVAVIVFYFIDEALRPIDKFNVINFFAWGLGSLVLGPAFAMGGFFARRWLRWYSLARNNRESHGISRRGQ